MKFPSSQPPSFGSNASPSLCCRSGSCEAGRAVIADSGGDRSTGEPFTASTVAQHAALADVGTSGKQRRRPTGDATPLSRYDLHDSIPAAHYLCQSLY